MKRKADKMRTVLGSKSAKKKRRQTNVALPQRPTITRTIITTQPEMNSLFYNVNTALDSGNTHSNLVVTDLKSGVNVTSFPRIKMGNVFGTKIGNKCMIRRIGVKLVITGDTNMFNEIVHLWLVKKSQANKTDPISNEIWLPGSSPSSKELEWRNPDFLQNYTVLKHWKIILATAGEDDAKYPIIGEIKGFIPPKPILIEKNFSMADIYDNTGEDGDISTATGVTYSIMGGCAGLSDGWIIGSPDVSIKGTIKVSFTEK